VPGICCAAQRRHREALDGGRRDLWLACALSVVVLGMKPGTSPATQKMKVAAIEAEWRTEEPPASFTYSDFPTCRHAQHTRR